MREIFSVRDITLISISISILLLGFLMEISKTIIVVSFILQAIGAIITIYIMLIWVNKRKRFRIVFQ